MIADLFSYGAHFLSSFSHFMTGEIGIVLVALIATLAACAMFEDLRR